MEFVFIKLGETFSTQVLIEFFLSNGLTEYNYIESQKYLEEHLDNISTGKVNGWGAFNKTSNELVGIITAISGGQYRLNFHPQKVFEIIEFVVHKEYRGQGIGKHLATLAKNDIFQNNSETKTIYVMLHTKNKASFKAFHHSGWREIITFEDKLRKRDTTVLSVNRPMRILGIQSGNALDSIDIVIVEFDEPIYAKNDRQINRFITNLNYKVLAYTQVPWDDKQRELILKLREGNIHKISTHEYAEAKYILAKAFAKAGEFVLQKNNIDKKSIDLVSSHGQSIYGHPHWELGDPSAIANYLDITTVGDFRPADVAAGGNGSPCTCTYDSIILRPNIPSELGWRIAINIGGTTSITFCPPINDDAVPIGLDPGLGVFFMDLAARHYDDSLEYDINGNIARRGKIHQELLEIMMMHPHIQREKLPISVGVDDFPRELFYEWQKLSWEKGLLDEDFLATLTEFTAQSLSYACQRFFPQNKPIYDIIIRGGIRHNIYFMERLLFCLKRDLNQKNIKLLSLADIGLDEESWETVMYAMFGFLCIRGIYNFIPSCTGASHSVIAGKICPASNYKHFNLY